MAVLIIRNVPNSFRTGEVITALTDESKLTDGVDKTLYEEKHGPNTWDRRTVVVIVTDKEIDSPEIQALLEEDETGKYRRKRFVLPQDSSSPFYPQLIGPAKITATYQMLQGLIV